MTVTVVTLFYAQNPFRTYPRNFPVDGEGEVANLSPTSRCNGIWETTQHNRHNGLLPTPTCYTDLLQTSRLCCGLDTGKLPTCYGIATGKWCNGFWPLLLKFAL